ncbi:hypothetical protein [Chromobacterium sp. IIBBL 290-4]|uniref:hypothetical protein n=1 Tax=Chromobacterium sp. IIBBL 290-4 TaxID=2953890 RepID=UPI0020B7F8DF|nr:hypothetical protein [Chromobacterium sp. IIBBL 290-4]UTH74974.1 hypothetical protein NKT35_02390 [Chromobacterium sp. IIBBL 290-4]
MTHLVSPFTITQLSRHDQQEDNMPTIKPRNPLACAPILKKGGAHGQSRSGQRRSQKQAMWMEWEDWQDERQLAAQQQASDAEEVFLKSAAPKETGHHPMACFFWGCPSPAVFARRGSASGM